jgi:hypothetical protein
MQNYLHRLCKKKRQKNFNARKPHSVLGKTILAFLSLDQLIYAFAYFFTINSVLFSTHQKVLIHNGLN